MRTHPAADWHNYLAVFCSCSVVVIAGVAALNYQVDPYLIHQWGTPQVQRLRPDRERLSAWGKTYALAKLRPAVIYAGNSRTELGLPTQTPLFDGKVVFNGALSGASLGDALDMVRHAAVVSRLDTVVWGVDAPSFSMEIGNTEFDRELVASDRYYLWRRGLLNVKRGLTMDMTMDTLRLLNGSYGQSCHSSLALYGQRDEACVMDRIGRWGATGKGMLPRTREFVRGAGPTPQAMQALDASTRALCRDGTRLRLYVNPTHAMTIDALYWSGKWPALEAWLGWLAELAQARRNEGCDLRVYAFSGFNRITTEAIPQVSGREQMQYYWEASHYRVNVGHMILARMFGGGQADAGGFGAELLPSAMPAYLAGQRAARDRYHLVHAEETRLARKAVVLARQQDATQDTPGSMQDRVQDRKQDRQQAGTQDRSQDRLHDRSHDRAAAAAGGG